MQRRQAGRGGGEGVCANGTGQLPLLECPELLGDGEQAVPRASRIRILAEFLRQMDDEPRGADVVRGVAGQVVGLVCEPDREHHIRIAQLVQVRAAALGAVSCSELSLRGRRGFRLGRQVT